MVLRVDLELDAIGHVPWWPREHSEADLHRILVQITEYQRSTGRSQKSTRWSPHLPLLARAISRAGGLLHIPVQNLARAPSGKTSKARQLGRWPPAGSAAREVAEIVLILVTDRVANVTGADITIDGGLIPAWCSASPLRAPC